MLNKIIIFLHNILISLEHYQEHKEIIKNKYYVSHYFEPCCEKTYRLMIDSYLEHRTIPFEKLKSIIASWERFGS